MLSTSNLADFMLVPHCCASLAFLETLSILSHCVSKHCFTGRASINSSCMHLGRIASSCCGSHIACAITSRPAVLHCICVCTGIGRTGTFCAVDIALQRLRSSDYGEAVSAAELKPVVAELRRQRAGMVQTPEQYHFCYQVCPMPLAKAAVLARRLSTAASAAMVNSPPMKACRTSLASEGLPAVVLQLCSYQVPLLPGVL